LWEAADSPKPAAIVVAAKLDKTNGPKRISDWRNAKNVPRDQTEFNRVVTVLINRVKPDRRFSGEPLFSTETWARWRREAEEAPLGPSATAQLSSVSSISDTSVPIRIVSGARSRFLLGIHEAISLPEDADQGLSGEFPEYVERDIDAPLREWIRTRVRTQTAGLVVLVGDAAAGKTRCLYEALAGDADVQHWRMPQVDTGAQINAMIQERVDLSRIVLWLDELQKYFVDDVLTAGSVRQLIAGRLGPVLLAGTIRNEELQKLQVRPEPDDEVSGRRHAREVIRMLARWSKHSGPSEPAVRFHVNNHFSPEEVNRAEILARRDPRLRSALRDADDRNVTATLAGAQELIDRWTLDTGDGYGQAIITAAVTARRCGHPEPIPVAVLEVVALAQLAARATAPVTFDWLQAAIQWAESPMEGNIAALRQVLTAPGIVDGYKVSDILLQYSYVPACHEVRSLLSNDRTWTLLQEYAARSVHMGIGDAAYAEGKAETAVLFWRLAAETKDIAAMRRLGWFYTTNQKDLPEARRWFQQAINLGDVAAMASFGDSLERFEESTESLHWIRQAADHGDANAMVSLGLRLQGVGRIDEAETWYRRAASLDNAIAMANLGYLFRQRGDAAEAERWNRLGAALGQPGATSNLAELLKERGELDEALEWFRKGADRAMSLVAERPSYYVPWPGECNDLGVSNAVMGLAELLSERGELAEAELWFRKIAELGDARPAAILADIYDGRGEETQSRRWRKKAAELADANLARNKSSLLNAYGESAVLRHVEIIQDYADYLSSHGEVEMVSEWYLRALTYITQGQP
jgi:TPR repeat protein